MLARLTYGLRIYGKLQLLHTRAHLEYEADFWVGILGVALRHAAGFVFVWTLFGRVKEIQGWSFWEIVFLYGLSIVPLGLVEIFYDGQWQLRQLVRLGELDRLLVRPVSPALQVITQLCSIHGFGSVLLGSTLLIRSGSVLDLEWGAGEFAYLIVTLVSSVLLIGSLNYISNCVAFFDPGANVAVPLLVQTTTEFAKFPLELYGRLVQVLITWILPLTFVSYFPGRLLLHKAGDGLWLGVMSPFVGPLLVVITAWVWRKSLGLYQGVGH